MATVTHVHLAVTDYQKACEDLAAPVHPYIEKMLNREKTKSTKKMTPEGYYYLGGNNDILTTQRLTDTDCLVLKKTFVNNPSLVFLDLRYNNITDKGAKAIGELVEKNSSIRYLNVMGNDITGEGATSIAKALHTNKSLRELVMTGNKIDNLGGLMFAQALQVNSTLKALDLGDTDQGSESLIAIATVLKYNSTVEHLNVNRPLVFTMGEEPTIHIAEMLHANKTLKELHLMKFGMTDYGASTIAEHLLNNRSLVHLNISCNRITRDGALKFAKVLQTNTTLQYLDFGFNRLGDAGAIYLAEVLTYKNHKLVGLSLKFNEMKGKGLCAIAECLKHNTTLEQLYIWGNTLEESACLAFRHLLDSTRLLEKNTDVRAVIVDEKTHLAEVCNGLREVYYIRPAYGDHADPMMAEIMKDFVIPYKRKY